MAEKIEESNPQNKLPQVGKEAELLLPINGQGKRNDQGKVRYELIPTHLLESTANVFDFGARKYSSWNWLAGMPWSKVIGCMKRHLAAIERGEDIDPESGLPHIGHLMCNALMLEHYRLSYKEGDDRPSDFFRPK